MLTFEQILALLARVVAALAPDLPDDERAELVLTDDERDALAAGIFAEPASADATPQLRTEFTDEQRTELAAALLTTADAILDADGTPSDDDLAALEFIAQASEACTAAEADAAAAEVAAQERAAQLAERIRGQASGDDGEGGEGAEDDGADGGDGEEDDDAAGDGGDGGVTEGAESAEAVAASARANVPRPRHTRPRTAGRQVTPLTASANVPGTAMGARLDTPQALGLAFANTLEAMSGMALAPGMKVPVAQARVTFPTDSMLSMHDVRGNERMIERYVGVAAVAASGGVQAPPVPRFDLPMFGTDARPVRDALPRFGSERGGSIIPSPIMLDDLEGAATVWTEAMDVSAATDPNVRKPCLRMTAGTDETVLPYAIVNCLEIGNWNARTWPERVTRFTEKAAQWTSRMADSRLLTRIGSLSTQVTVAQLLGTVRDVLATMDRAGSQMRNRHRLLPETPLRWMAPATLRDNMRTDLSREMPGSAQDRLAAADAVIEAFFAARHINVTWFLDGEAGQVYGSQSDGALNGWKPNVVSYLFPEGTFILLDGGGLDLGVVRDSVLNAKNDFQMFSEIWEEVAMVGYESLRLNMSLRPSGATSGTVNPVSADVASS